MCEGLLVNFDFSENLLYLFYECSEGNLRYFQNKRMSTQDPAQAGFYVFSIFLHLVFARDSEQIRECGSVCIGIHQQTAIVRDSVLLLFC